MRLNEAAITLTYHNIWTFEDKISMLHLPMSSTESKHEEAMDRSLILLDTVKQSLCFMATLLNGHLPLIN